ncbi:MAG: signal peptidase I [Rhodobacteraceae bacterium]|jgi:signal peptidase I|nr:signal peptidase I [Paracoccaceae bacterium]
MASADKDDGGIVELIKTVFWALLIAGVFRTLFFQPFWIPSASMKDTLLIGDFLFVNKMAYGYSRYSCPFALCPISGRILASEPERGDVIVFRHPTRGVDYIKRLIGLPGDTIQMKDGLLYINGTLAPQEPAGTFAELIEPQGPEGKLPNCETRDGTQCLWSRSRETLPNGVSHDVINIGNGGAGTADNTDMFTVPEGTYFFMGDNRDDSLDSRFPSTGNGVGFVPAEYLIGRADRVIFSSAGRRLVYFWTWRADRFFHAIE